MMPDPSLNDEQLENEIKLVGDLVLAASQAEGPMSDDQIDELLGIAPDAGAPETPDVSEAVEPAETAEAAEPAEAVEPSRAADSA
ncbi:hypothetical protein [Oryzobacter terrae]|uniref:hypothetical protein n=1 Tax=Oryzobacter terrae TaxID=1620385 RepID=UPI00366C46DA